MSLYKFRIFIVLVMLCALTGLSACGFKPLYNTANQTDLKNGQVTPFTQIAIPNIPDRSGQYLRNKLLDQMGGGAQNNDRYELRVSALREQITRLGIRKDASATRAQMLISTTLQLYDRYTGEIVLTRPLRATNSYNILNSQYTTQVSETYARERTLDSLADDIIRQIALFFNRTTDSPT